MMRSRNLLLNLKAMMLMLMVFLFEVIGSESETGLILEFGFCLVKILFYLMFWDYNDIMIIRLIKSDYCLLNLLCVCVF